MTIATTSDTVMADVAVVPQGTAPTAPGGTTPTVTKEASEKFLAAFATSLAAKVTETLLEQVTAAKAEAEAKKLAEEEAAKKAEEEAAAAEVAEQTKTQEEKDVEAKANITKPEDMKDSLHKIDAIREKESGERKFVAWDEARTRKPDDDQVPDEHSKWVLVLRRVFGYENELRKTKLDVKSPLIRKVIRETVEAERAAMESEKGSLHWPNDDIFRFRDHIKEAAEKEGELAIKHVAVLTKLINSDFAGRIADIKHMFPKGTSTYEILREAFWAGDIIIDACHGFSRAWRVTSVNYVTTWDNKEYLDVDAEFIDNNGKEFGTISANFQIPKFKGVKYFTDLAVFPLKYHEKKDEIRQNLLKQGKKFASLQGQQYMAHKGVGMTVEYCPSRVNIDSRVMLDTTTFNRIKTNFEIGVSSIKDELVEGELTEEHLILCTNRIPIFSFQDKQFYTTSIHNIFEICFNDRVFDQLVLPQSQKELVRVLVENHSKGAAFDDFVEGKGKGLISVLHGPPGVGKTMTAEAVAEFTRRPLYIVTSGELGSSPSQMESELKRVLDLAKTFRAVLLLDEADVFLEQRTTHDLVRNALVSIFLRQLEYYQGILFLTTNRVATFDEAFHSRIHISLYYQNLSMPAREQVWRNFGATMRVDLKDADYALLAKEVLNGRQVKNIFRTAQALAADKGEDIGMKHLQLVLEVMKGFDLAKMKSGGAMDMESVEQH